MHVSDGILSAPVLVAGAAAAAAGLAVGLRKLDYRQVPRVAVLTSAFFVASLIHVPVGPTSAHLVLNGLVGLILGWVAFPAILIGLALQAVLFGHGGLTALGVNTFVMAAPAVVCGMLFGRCGRAKHDATAFACGFGAAAVATAMSAGIVGLVLTATGGEDFDNVVKAVWIAHIPVAVIEGGITGVAVAFLRKVRPELLERPLGPSRIEETTGV